MSKTQIQTSKTVLIAFVLSLVLAIMLITAISFEFYVEELAKAYVVPMLVAATFISFGVIGMLLRSLPSA